MIGVEVFAEDQHKFILGHIAAPQIVKSFPNLVFLHISDAIAYAIKEKKLKKVLNKMLRGYNNVDSVNVGRSSRFQIHDGLG